MRITLIDNEFGHLEYELLKDKPFIHLKIYKWSKNMYVEYLKAWHIIKCWFKNQGYKDLWVSIPTDDPKLLKFEEMFGFRVVHEEFGHYLLKQEL